MGNIRQERNTVRTFCFGQFKDTADHHSAAVFDEHLSFDVFGVDRKSCGCGLTYAVFVDINVSKIILPSGVICGVTSSFRFALRKAIEVAPLALATG
jgi:hypothetical protein